MVAADRTYETLERILEWLTRQQAVLSPLDWESLGAAIGAAFESVHSLIARGDLRGAVAALERIVAEHIIKQRDAESAEVSYWLEWFEPGTRSAETPDRAPVFEIDSAGETMRGGETPARAMDPLRRILSLLSFGRAQTAIDTHPEVLLPTEVGERTTFFLTVAAHAAETPHSIGKLSLSRGQPGPVDLEVELVLPASQGLVAAGPTAAVLRVHEDGRAAAIRFELFAASKGVHPIAVAFRHGGIERARHEGRVLVRTQEEHAHAPSSEAHAGLQGAAVAPGRAFAGLLLQIDLRGVSADFRSFRVVLGGGGWSGPAIEGRVELPAEAAHLLAELCREMTSIAKLETPQTRELRLRAIGRTLARRALPDPIREALADPHWAPGTSLHIESSDLHVPWEMLLLGDTVTGEFLGERFAVTRYPRLGTPRELVGGAAGILVAPRSSGLQVGTERAALQALLGQAQELSHLEQVQELLVGPARCGVLHLACHGNCAATGTFRDMLLLDGGPLSVVDVAVPERGQRSALDGALVFINACRANIAEPGLWGHDGWAGAFLRAGAGAVVAPSWTVSDRGAALFAERLYQSSAGGQLLGEAARQARLQAASRGSADRLGYSVFASPTARLLAN